MAPTDVLISAGEASGDMYAARLAMALRQRTEVRLFGMGGPRMRDAGVDTVVDCAEVGVVGFSEVIRKLPAVYRAWRRLILETERRRPSLAILTDFPGFHLRLARALQQRQIRNVYFVCPQFWAWRPGRVKLIRERFVRGLCIFEFEETFYRQAGVAADWIGHPLVDQVAPKLNREQFCRMNGLDSKRPIIAILPGSRPSELDHHMPYLVSAAKILSKSGDRQFAIALAPGLKKEQLAPYLVPELSVRIVEHSTYELLAAANLAIVSSGTATVEAALIGVPMIVIYRVAAATAWIVRQSVRTSLFAMVNLIAGQKVVPELIQDQFTPENVVQEAERLLSSAEAREEMRGQLALVKKRLGPPGAIERAADIIAPMLTA